MKLFGPTQSLSQCLSGQRWSIVCSTQHMQRSTIVLDVLDCIDQRFALSLRQANYYIYVKLLTMCIDQIFLSPLRWLLTLFLPSQRMTINETRKTLGTAENPAHQHILLCDIPINIINKYMYNVLISYHAVYDFDFDISRSHKVKCDGVTGLPVSFNISVNSVCNLLPN